MYDLRLKVSRQHVDIGGASTPMAIAVATSVGDGFKSWHMDGILGLGFKELNRGEASYAVDINIGFIKTNAKGFISLTR